jgi:DNA-binding transcriptional ArsR family regulator
MPEHALRDHRLNGDADIPMVAGLIADDARATMLLALHTEGRALSMSVLAAHARIGLPAASAHLARLVGGGLVACERQGRSRLYRLSGPHVADVLEALAALAPIRPPRTLDESSRLAALRLARTCYDHLAGRLGAGLFEALVQHAALVAVPVPVVPTRRVRSGLGAVALGPRAADIFGRLGVELDESLDARACLDWTESRPHLSGGLGADVCAAFLERGWVLHRPNTRALRMSDAGRRALAELLDLHFCAVCGNVTALDPCSVCRIEKRTSPEPTCHYGRA